jgi:hypothetical protein
MRKILRKIENIYAAAAFAEAGEFDTAREILRDEDRDQKRKRIHPRKTRRKQLRAPGMKT